MARQNGAGAKAGVSVGVVLCAIVYASAAGPLRLRLRYPRSVNDVLVGSDVVLAGAVVSTLVRTAVYTGANCKGKDLTDCADDQGARATLWFGLMVLLAGLIVVVGADKAGSRLDNNQRTRTARQAVCVFAAFSFAHMVFEVDARNQRRTASSSATGYSYSAVGLAHYGLLTILALVLLWGVVVLALVQARSRSHTRVEKFELAFDEPPSPVVTPPPSARSTITVSLTACAAAGGLCIKQYLTALLAAWALKDSRLRHLIAALTCLTLIGILEFVIPDVDDQAEQGAAPKDPRSLPGSFGGDESAKGTVVGDRRVSEAVAERISNVLDREEDSVVRVSYEFV